MKRKFFIALLTLLLAVCSLGLVACDFGGNDSDEDYEIYYENGLQYISSKLESYYNTADYYIVKASDFSITEVIIPSTFNNKPVKEIGNNAFKDCSALTSITIPDSVTRIGSYAFENCSSLTNITIPDSVNIIGIEPFKGCASLSSITIPDSITSIDNWAFADCSSLTSLNYTGTIDQWAMIDFGYDSPNPLRYAKHLYINGVEVTEVNLTTATYISRYAFKNCESITSVTIGGSVTSIGSSAFESCSALTSITIPDSVTSIGGGAFYNCPIQNATIPTLAIEYIPQTNLTTVVITSGNSIDDNAFSGCSALKSITIHDSVTSIGNEAFSGCSALTSVTIPDSVTSIGYRAFENCSALTTITIPDSVTRIGSYAFENCSALASIIIPNSVTEINSSTFNGCCALTTITIPDSVTWIGGSAFSGCDSLQYNVYDNAKYLGNANNPYLLLIDATDTSITSCEINPNCKFIYDSAFEGCLKLTRVDYTGTIDQWVMIDFDGFLSNPLYYAKHLYINGEEVTEVNLTTATYISDYAFCNCESITSVTIPDSVTSIGYGAFSGCYDLTSVNYTGTIDQWAMIDFEFDGSSNPLYYAKHLYINGVEVIEVNLTTATYISDYAFHNCNSITSVTIGDSVTSISDYAFYNCNSITSVTIGDSVTSIGNEAFADCSAFTSVTIGDSVTSIGSWAFADCSAFTSVNYTGTIDQWAMIDFIDSYSNPLSNAKHLYINGVEVTEVNLTTATYISDYAFDNCESITSVTIGDSVTSIGERAFSGCSALTSITIPDSVTSIGYYAFSGCSALTSITIPDSVTSIDDGAFSGCSALTSVTIGDNVTSIGEYAFDDCDNLQYNVYDNAKYLGNANNPYLWLIEATSTSITSCEINPNCKFIYYYAFSGCSNLQYNVYNNAKYLGNANNPYLLLMKATDTSITSCEINTNCKFIYGYAFYECDSLTSITIPDSVTSIGARAFFLCDNLISITIPDSVTSIGDYAFYGCNRLTRITFTGTKAQWEAINGSGWYSNIYCTDGEIAK